MKKILTVLIALLFVPLSYAATEKVKIGDLYYSLDDSNNTAEITYEIYWDKTNYQSLPGIVTIPEIVVYNENKYIVTSIGEAAFKGCSGLTSVTIPNSVTSIGYYAFMDCSGLTSVTIPNSVTSIRSYAFEGCQLETLNIDCVTIKSWFSGNETLTTLTIGNSVTSIGDEAFSGCSGLTSVAIPNSVTSIGDEAFSGCRGLTSVTFPPSITYIGAQAFYGCGGLASLTFEDGEEVLRLSCQDSYMSGEGTSDDEKATNLIFRNCPVEEIYLGRNLSYRRVLSNVGGTVFYDISVSPFENKQSLKKVYLGNSVTSIETSSFKGCTGLTSVEMGNSVTNVGSQAFYGCTGLTGVTIPNSVTNVGSQAFYGCSGLTSVEMGNSVTNVGNQAFYGCTELIRVDISDLEAWCKIDFGPQYANPLSYAQHFYVGNEEIKDFLIIPDGVTSIGNYAFSGCSSLTSVTIPNSVTSIGESAFSGCSGLTSVTIPNSVTSIDNYAFGDCSGLTKLVFNAEKCTIKSTGTFPSTISKVEFGKDVVLIPSYLLSGCKSLTSVTIPNSVTSIGESAFSGCSGLTSVEMGNSVTSIGWSAFKGCSGLTSVTIPNSVTSIDYYAFMDCSGLTSVTIPNSVTSIRWSAFEGCTALTNVTIGDSVSEIERGTFSGCTALTNVTIGKSVSEIESYAFEGCPLETLNIDCVTINSWFSGNETLTTLMIGNSVTSIGAEAFYNCSGLTSVEMGNSVTSIGAEAFGGCTGLKKVNINDSDSWYNIEFSGFASNPLYYAGHLYLDNEEITELSIPDSITEIGNYLFCGYVGLKEVILHNSITTVGREAFGDCTGLKKVKINDMNSWYNIEFSGVASNPLYYAGHLYLNNEEITELSIPQMMNEIKDYTFSGWSGLQSIIFPNSVSSIGVGTFLNCSGLTSVSFPVSLIQIGDFAFEDCTGLDSIIFNSTQLLTINYKAFSGCENLNSIICNTLRPPVSDDKHIFDSSTYSKATLFVPVSQLDLYYTMDPWKYFSNISVISGISNIEIQAYGDTEMQTGTTLQLYLTTPEIPGLILNADTWSSSDINVASVNGQGLVTAIAPGTAVITASDAYGHNASAIISVKSGGSSGIESLDSGTEKPFYILTIDGIVIKENATQEDIDVLTPGIYIIGGKKVIVK